MTAAGRAVGLLLAVAAMVSGCDRQGGGCRREHAAPAPVPEPAVSAFRHMVMPTDRETLDPESPEAFQPTAAGDFRSALYGSVRTAQVGKGVAPSFHEGIDIAPLRRNARGQPLDTARAVADGKVAYVNRYPGNSNYGNYVVLTHVDPMGEVYTLYAHLAEVASHLRPGLRVRSGDTLGLMGHTPPSIIPAARAHLHFEVGVVANARFGDWFRVRRMLPDHGAFNGLNLQGVSPLTFFKVQAAASEFEFRQVLRETPVAFEVLLAATHRLDYFRRYPSLWNGEEVGEGWIALSCSENGTVLAGRAATVDEIAKACGAGRAVLSVNEAALGRNGCRLVIRDGDKWRLGAKANQWLEILEF
jgi:murein DD-endopeptidase MepM/ murein hydrolase activator NlpD